MNDIHRLMIFEWLFNLGFQFQFVFYILFDIDVGILKVSVKIVPNRSSK